MADLTFLPRISVAQAAGRSWRMPGKGKHRSLGLLFSEVVPRATTREIPKCLSIRRSVRFAPQGAVGLTTIETEGLDVIERLGKRTCGSRTATALQEFSEVDTARQQINLPAVFLGADEIREIRIAESALPRLRPENLACHRHERCNQRRK